MLCKHTQLFILNTCLFNSESKRTNRSPGVQPGPQLDVRPAEEHSVHWKYTNVCSHHNGPDHDQPSGVLPGEGQVDGDTSLWGPALGQGSDHGGEPAHTSG